MVISWGATFIQPGNCRAVLRGVADHRKREWRRLWNTGLAATSGRTGVPNSMLKRIASGR
jgi:hypothetical protein